MFLAKNKPSSKTRRRAIVGLLIMLAYAVLMVFLPAPAPVVEQKLMPSTIDTQFASSVPFPDARQASLSLQDQVVAFEGDDSAVPIASVTKTITALAIMRQKPLKEGEQGPSITFTAADQALYDEFYVKGGSVFPVKAGEQITQHQALQALLIPSANNIAVTLTRWAFGSDQEYLSYANNMLKEMGLEKTKVADASGFSENTVSTAGELTKIGQAVLADPVLRQIVAQRSADLPGGEVLNVNSALGKADINGIKTGFTNEAGGCLLFSATRQAFGRPITIVAAIVGAPTRAEALEAAPEIINKGFLNIIEVEAVKNQQTVATVKTLWDDSTNIVVSSDLKAIAWKGQQLDLEVNLNSHDHNAQLKLGDQTVSAQLERQLKKPSIIWRLTHPFAIVAGLFKQNS